MFVGITNTPRDYAWGSRTAIPALLGTAASGDREAELWLGTHPGSPSRLVVPDADGNRTLADLTTLPFLLKVLAAELPLSLQAHPTTAQAIEGFARENAEGIPLDSPTRNYKDAAAKPELIFALEVGFRALCGFRPVSETREVLALLGSEAGPLLDRLADDAALPGTFEWLISGGESVDELVIAVVAAAAAAEPRIEFETVARLAETNPGDPGIVISLLLNVVELRRGEVLYLPAGNIHAYLNGLGIELMSASDNVLRGGLTPKHVDVPELLHVLDFRPVPVPYLLPTEAGPGVSVYAPGVADFQLAHVFGDDLDVEVQLPGESIVLCVAGGVSLSSAGSSGSSGFSGEPGGDSDARPLARGEADYVRGESATGGMALRIAGSGELFIATTGTTAI